MSEYHHELAVHSVGHTTVSRDTMPEILDLKRSFQSACEESSEWSNERCECCKNEDVELNGCDYDGVGDREEFPK